MVTVTEEIIVPGPPGVIGPIGSQGPFGPTGVGATGGTGITGSVGTSQTGLTGLAGANPNATTASYPQFAVVCIDETNNQSFPVACIPGPVHVVYAKKFAPPDLVPTGYILANQTATSVTFLGNVTVVRILPAFVTHPLNVYVGGLTGTDVGINIKFSSCYGKLVYPMLQTIDANSLYGVFCNIINNDVIKYQIPQNFFPVQVNSSMVFVYYATFFQGSYNVH